MEVLVPDWKGGFDQIDKARSTRRVLTVLTVLTVQYCLAWGIEDLALLFNPDWVRYNCDTCTRLPVVLLGYNKVRVDGKFLMKDLLPAWRQRIVELVDGATDEDWQQLRGHSLTGKVMLHLSAEDRLLQYVTLVPQSRWRLDATDRGTMVYVWRVVDGQREKLAYWNRPMSAQLKEVWRRVLWCLNMQSIDVTTMPSADQCAQLLEMIESYSYGAKGGMCPLLDPEGRLVMDVEECMWELGMEMGEFGLDYMRGGWVITQSWNFLRCEFGKVKCPQQEAAGTDGCGAQMVP